MSIRQRYCTNNNTQAPLQQSVDQTEILHKQQHTGSFTTECRSDRDIAQTTTHRLLHNRVLIRQRHCTNNNTQAPSQQSVDQTETLHKQQHTGSFTTECRSDRDIAQTTTHRLLHNRVSIRQRHCTNNNTQAPLQQSVDQTETLHKQQHTGSFTTECRSDRDIAQTTTHRLLYNRVLIRQRHCTNNNTQAPLQQSVDQTETR